MIFLFLMICLSTLNACTIRQCKNIYTNECIDSLKGIRCVECNGMGYLVNNTNLFEKERVKCQCYNSFLNPNTKCKVENKAKSTKMEIQKYNIRCIAHQSKELGFYKSDNLKECLLPILGPAPNVKSEDLSLPIETCNTYVGFDPISKVLKTCSGHGIWNRKTYSCECDFNWSLENTNIKGIDNEDVFLCSKCRGLYGPQPGHEIFAPCSRIWIPNPKTGKEEECSGGGRYIKNLFGDYECQCNVGFTLKDFTQTIREYENGKYIDTIYTVKTCL